MPAPAIAWSREIAPAWVAADVGSHPTPSAGRVVSVHGAVVNLAVDGWDHLLMVADPSLYRGPSAVGLSATGFAAVRAALAAGAAIRVEAGALLFDGPGPSLRVDLGGPTTCFGPPDTLEFVPDACRVGLAQALADLRATTARDLCSVLLGSHQLDDPFSAPIAWSFPAVVRALVAGDEPGFVEAARGLVGLGYGSTPTGDDLLHGALVAAHYAGRTARTGCAAPRLPRAVSRATTRLGAHMIATGNRGLTPEPVRDLLIALLAGRSVCAELCALDAMGADSGRSMAVGAVLTLAALLEDALEGREAA